MEDAKADSPDEIAEALHKRVGILKNELTELRQDNAAHAEQIKVKEEELSQVRAQIKELVGDLHNHPCPYDPKFPKFDDYELEIRQFKGHSDWWCSAKPKTEMASKLELDTTRGDTPEDAKARMRERYELEARNVPKNA